VETSAKANGDGVVYEPPAPPDRLPKVAAGVVAGLLVIAGVVYGKRGPEGQTRDLT
jgi:hypothetical protein